MIHHTQSTQISQKQDEHNICAIMKTMCPAGYHHNGFVATHSLGHMMYGYALLVLINQRVLNKLSKERNKVVLSDPQQTALNGSLVPVMCNRISCAQVHELPQLGGHIVFMIAYIIYCIYFFAKVTMS